MVKTKKLQWTSTKVRDDTNYWKVVPVNCSIQIMIEQMGENGFICRGRSKFRGPDSLEQAKEEIQVLHEAEVNRLIGLIDQWTVDD